MLPSKRKTRKKSIPGVRSLQRRVAYLEQAFGFQAYLLNQQSKGLDLVSKLSAVSLLKQRPMNYPCFLSLVDQVQAQIDSRQESRFSMPELIQSAEDSLWLMKSLSTLEPKS